MKNVNSERKVVRLRKASALGLPLIHELYLKALANGALNPEASIAWTSFHLQDPQVGVFIGLADGLPRTLVQMVLPYNPQTNHPLLDLLAGGGDRILTKMTLRAGLEFVRQAGYDTVWCFNFSKHPDAAYFEAMKRLGCSGAVRATMMEMQIG